MRLVFAGTPVFASAFLEELIERSDQHLVAVYTQPDRRAGRGKQLRPSPVKELALQAGIPVYQPESLRNPEIQKELASLKPDLMVVVAYGQILPREVLEIPRYGCINVHASLLPRWRGAAPIHRAIAAGDDKTGISIMAMDDGLDTGGVLAEKELDIDPTDTTGSLHDKLVAVGQPLLVDVINQLPAILKRAKPQDGALATYARKISSEEAALNWELSATELGRWIRALAPAPGAFAVLDGERIKVRSAFPGHRSGMPGEILHTSDEGIEVACGDLSLVLIELQLPGKKPMQAAEILRGHSQRFAPGRRFDLDSAT